MATSSPLLPIVVVRRHHLGQRRRAAFGLARVTLGVLGAHLRLFARGEIVEQADRAVVIEVFVIIRSEEHTSELQSLMRISYAVFCLKKTKHALNKPQHH